MPIPLSIQERGFKSLGALLCPKIGLELSVIAIGYKKLRSIGAVIDLGCFNIRLPRKPSFKQGFLNRSFPSCLKPLFLSEEQLISQQRFCT